MPKKIWQKWIQTILPELHRRDKWLTDSKPIQIDEIILVEDDRAPRNCYEKARVIGLNQGADGKFRSVSMQTVDGVYVRPITKLAILDVYDKINEGAENSIPCTDQGV